MTDTPRAYRAICFDLDGTLLPMDLDEFMGTYFAVLRDFVTRNGLDGDAFVAALNVSIRAMATHRDDRTNAEAFWDEFFRHVDRNATDWEALLEAFYRDDFGRIGANVTPGPAVARVLEKLAAKGYPLMLTTMPMFPLEAVKGRLRWAGADPDAFARITTFDNSRAVKPRPIYYAENLAAADVAGRDVLMVGNNTVEDLAFMELGADAFLVTDWMIDPVGYDLSRVKHGSMADFEAWADALPACVDPVTRVKRGAIAPAAARAALAANAPGGSEVPGSNGEAPGDGEVRNGEARSGNGDAPTPGNGKTPDGTFPAARTSSTSNAKETR